MKLSLCMIVKDEEDVLERCLLSAKEFVDEIIIVDTGSHDSTKEIAFKYTSNVYDFTWVDDFSKARNYSFSKATGDYIIWLDADDVITPVNSNKILTLKNTYNTQTDIFMFKYNVAYDENDNVTFTYYRERIIRNSPMYRWVSPIHEVIPLIGNIVYSDISIEHKKQKANPPRRNLNIFNKMLNEGITLDARQQFYYGRELFYNGEDVAAIKILESFLKLDDGWVENKIDACKLLGTLHNKCSNVNLALEALFKSFLYDKPRSNICCDIGKVFFEQENYELAVFWYELASNRKDNMLSNAFIEPDTYGYIPYIQLCVCYYHLGDLEKANFYNEMAGKIKPNDSAYLYNKKLFSATSSKSDF